MTKTVDKVRTIRIGTLEDKSKKTIEDWIAEWNDENEPVEIASQTEIIIGEIEYQPVKWQCPDCKRWNYELTFVDNAEAAACCEHCHKCNEF